MKQEELIGKLGEALFEPVEKLTLSTELNSIDGWDSLGRLSIAAMFHETFGLTVQTQVLNQCTTIQDIVSFVSDKLEINENSNVEALYNDEEYGRLRLVGDK